MLELSQTKTFKKCLKKHKHNKSVLEELKKVIELLVHERPDTP
jgi:mRNA-degrading endonuclease YafQ of YafQ-DinJ toxin-antitoxin module